MSSLQSKIKLLELKSTTEATQFNNNKRLLLQRLNNFKKSFSPTEIIVGGFTLGFVTGYKNTHKKADQSLLARAFMFLNTLNWSQYLSK